MNRKISKNLRGNSSQFFVAGEICRRGYIAVVTMGNCPNTDILCSNIDGTKFAHVQVKTFVPGNRSCSVGMKAERDYGKSFYWILAGIPTPGLEKEFEYYIIPSRIMAKNVRECFNKWKNTPGKHMQKRDAENTIRAVHLPPRFDLNGWSIKRYLNRWDILEKSLKGK